MSISDLFEELHFMEVIQENPLQIRGKLLCRAPKILSQIASELKPLAADLSFHCICPTDITSIPLATALSLELEMPVFFLEMGKHLIRPGQTALLIDGSTSFSSRIQSTCKKLRSYNVQVFDALVLIEEGVKERKQCHKMGIELHSLWNTEDLQNSYSKIRSFAIS